MSRLIIRDEAPARYRELVRYLPAVSDRARALAVPTQLIAAVDDHQPHSRRALPAARVTLLATTLAALEAKLGSAPAAGQFLLEGNRAVLLRQNGGRSHRTRILAACLND